MIIILFFGFLTWLWIADIYSPTIPKNNNCIPEKKNKATINVDMPGVFILPSMKKWVKNWNIINKTLADAIKIPKIVNIWE